MSEPYCAENVTTSLKGATAQLLQGFLGKSVKPSLRQVVSLLVDLPTEVLLPILYPLSPLVYCVTAIIRQSRSVS